MLLVRASGVQARAATGCSSGKKAVTTYLDWNEDQAETITRKVRKPDGSTPSWRDAKKARAIQGTLLAEINIREAERYDPNLHNNKAAYEQVIMDSYRVSGEWHAEGLNNRERVEAYYKPANEVFE